MGGRIYMKNIQCNKECNNCKYLGARTDEKGYPFAWECLKYNDSINKEDFQSTKEFIKEI